MWRRLFIAYLASDDSSFWRNLRGFKYLAGLKLPTGNNPLFLFTSVDDYNLQLIKDCVYFCGTEMSCDFCSAGQFACVGGIVESEKVACIGYLPGAIYR
jgi:hypothetical protein